MIDFVKKCPVCGNDMVLSGVVDERTEEKKNIYVCLDSNCSHTEPAPDTFEGES